MFLSELFISLIRPLFLIKILRNTYLSICKSCMAKYIFLFKGFQFLAVQISTWLGFLHHGFLLVPARRLVIGLDRCFNPADVGLILDGHDRCAVQSYFCSGTSRTSFTAFSPSFFLYRHPTIQSSLFMNGG